MARFNNPEGKIPLQVAILGGALFCVITVGVFHKAIEKEANRQAVVQEIHCKQYGREIAKWAEQNRIANQCTSQQAK